MDSKTVLVAGGLGVIGRGLVAELTRRDGWSVIALSRRQPDFDSDARYLSLDLLDRRRAVELLGSLPPVSDAFFAALSSRPGAWDRPANLRMLVNLVDGLEAAKAPLRHVSLMQGSSYYGFHSLGGGRTPAKEDDARTTSPNFYYTQEDFLRARASQAGWTWFAPRPGAVCGFAVGNPMNLTLVIALYAALSRELDLPFRFPGTADAYERIFEVTDSGLLARSTVQAALEPACQNQAFNVTNGDCFRWCDLWPRFADHFKMACAPPQTISLARTMADKGPLWDAIVARHGLRPYRLDELVGWEFGDEEFHTDHDMLSSNVKRFRLGMTEVMDSETMFYDQFDGLRESRILS